MNNSLTLQKSYDLFSLISRLTANFPKKERHGLGIKLDNLLLELLSQIITAEQIQNVHKESVLLGAVIKAETAKFLLRLAMEKKLIKETNYFMGSETLVEICKMLNGWRKSLR